MLHADGAIAYLLDASDGLLHWAADAGISAIDERAWMRSLVVPLGVGMFGSAAADRSIRITADYPADTSFTHAWMTDQVVRTDSIRAMVVAPLINEDELMGALGVYTSRVGSLGECDASLVRALADHAASSLARARLIDQLARSQQELARRVEQEAILRAITARIAVLQEPTEVLQRIVDESRRLLDADGAHPTLMSEVGDFLVPAVMADTTDAATTAWLAAMEFPLGGGINGLAASERRVVWTRDYLNDERIPQYPEDRDVAIRMGLGCMAAAPLRGSKDIIGTLAISYPEPRDVPEHDQQLLQALADMAAIAVANSRLYQGTPRLGAALPLPALELAGHRVADRRRRPVHLPERQLRTRIGRTTGGTARPALRHGRAHRFRIGAGGCLPAHQRRTVPTAVVSVLPP